MFCPKCGTENLNDAKFCKKCGKNLKSLKSTSSPDVKTKNIMDDFKKWWNERDTKGKAVTALGICCLGAFLLIIIGAMITPEYTPYPVQPQVQQPTNYVSPEAALKKFDELSVRERDYERELLAALDRRNYNSTKVYANKMISLYQEGIEVSQRAKIHANEHQKEYFNLAINYFKLYQEFLRDTKQAMGYYVRGEYDAFWGMESEMYHKKTQLEEKEARLYELQREAF